MKARKHLIAAARAVAKDAEHWITVHPNGKEHKGSPVLINGAGQIIGGAGGKLTGKFVKPKSKSEAKAGSEGQHAPAIWLGPPSNNPPSHPVTTTMPGASTTAPTAGTTPPATPPATPPEPPKPAVNPHPRGSKESYEWEKARKQELSAKAKQLSEGATTIEQHRAAMAAHAAAHQSWSAWKQARPNEINEHARAFHFHKKEIAKLEREAKKGQPKQAKEPSKGRSFATESPEQVNTALKDRWGLGFANGVKQGQAKEYYRTQILYGPRDNPEEMNKRLQEYQRLQEVERQDPGHRLRGHTSIDITQNSTSAKAMRKIIAHVDSAMEQLEASGFDVKKALSKANVQLVAGSTGRANGHAWGGTAFGNGKDGYFSISPAKRGSFNEEQAALHEARMAAGKSRWSVSSSSKDQTRATIVHELAHALGMREGINSPDRLSAILTKMEPDFSKRRQWIRENISEYATSNIKETDAELVAMVTEPDYKRGTLPKELEDHVDWLLERKS